MSTSVFAVFSGGGVKAAAFVGAVKVAESQLNFRGVGGTSGGAIVAALMACGYKGDELENALFDAPYETFLKPQWRRFFLSGCKQGLVDSVPLLNWLRTRLQAKVKKYRPMSGVTFEDLIRHEGALPLKVVATDVSTQDIKIYSVKDTPTEEVAEAVLASCSFPIVFPPVKAHLVDGGVMSNLPMWLFDKDREELHEPTSVLGFALAPPHGRRNGESTFMTHIYSVFESILVAQDRVQEKYLDNTGLANVIRIPIPETATFDRKQSRTDRLGLIDAGKLAALEYFQNARPSEPERVEVPAESNLTEAKAALANGDHKTALSMIARDHIFRGGVAQDQGLVGERKFVRYYVDLMDAVTDRDKLEVLAQILATKITELDLMPYKRVVGIKKGNVLLAAQTAHVLRKPLAIVKSDLSYKIGAPFEGTIAPEERIVLVDDVASDGSILVRAVHQLHVHRVEVLDVVTLIERPEGDARNKLHTEVHRFLKSVCVVADDDIEVLVKRGAPFS